MSNLRILSLGAGVQSTTLALMIEHGEIPMVDCGIFADTMAEPKKVYEHLDWLEKKVSFPIHRVFKGNLLEDVINSVNNNTRVSTPPFFTKNKNTGKKGILLRQCTQDYKVIPINKKVRELLGLKKGQKVGKNIKVDMLMGISKDEIARTRINKLQYIRNIYPLIEKDMRRYHCLEWIKNHNYPIPPRSACTFCPYHSNIEWLNIKKNKNEWENVIKLDKIIRNKTKNIKDDLYLHKSTTPLDEVDLEEKNNQLDLFNDICDEAVCGV